MIASFSHGASFPRKRKPTLTLSGGNTGSRLRGNDVLADAAIMDRAQP